MTTIGFIGSGRLGGMVARLAVAAGYDVVLSNSRGPQTLQDLLEELGPRARAATAADAAAAGDLVVVSIPPRGYSAVPVEGLAGRPVLEVLNNITFWHLRSLARPPGATDRSALPIAGDDPTAKAAVTAFLDGIGYDTVDAGTLSSGGRRFAFGTRGFVAPYGGLNDERGTPAGVTAIRAALGMWDRHGLPAVERTSESVARNESRVRALSLWRRCR